ncbi:MAG: hypothetical protein K2W33_05065, partial [Burkholderiales bacterium]|nr:hypothetical protein [Burkholderiales bacterium]
MKFSRYISRSIWTALAAISLLLSGCATVAPRDQATGNDAPAHNSGGLFSLFPKGDGRPGLSPALPNDTLQPIQVGSTYSLNVTSLTPPSDIWDRIRRGFAMPDLEGDLVRDRTQW